MPAVPTALRLALAATGLFATAAAARAPGDPIRLVWDEGDVAGLTSIYAPDGDRPIGVIEYHQHRKGDLLTCARIAHFADGSSDEDEAVARIGSTLEAVSGRSIIRDRSGETTVDLSIDVAGGHLRGSWGTGADRQTVDKATDLPQGTYWGPLVFIVLKNFDANAEGGRVAFRTVAPTPKPYVIDLEFVRGDAARITRAGVALDTVVFDLNPTVHWALDPLIRLVAPRSRFFVQPGEPPALVRFTGPRNYARAPIRID